MTLMTEFSTKFNVIIRWGGAGATYVTGKRANGQRS